MGGQLFSPAKQRRPLNGGLSLFAPAGHRRAWRAPVRHTGGRSAREQAVRIVLRLLPLFAAGGQPTWRVTKAGERLPVGCRWTASRCKSLKAHRQGAGHNTRAKGPRFAQAAHSEHSLQWRICTRDCIQYAPLGAGAVHGSACMVHAFLLCAHCFVLRWPSNNALALICIRKTSGALCS